MTNTTTRADVEQRLDAGHRVVPVIRELFADGETPVGIYRKLAMGKPGTFLLESAEQGGIWSRFSFVGAASFGVLTQRDQQYAWLDYGMSEERALGSDHAELLVQQGLIAVGLARHHDEPLADGGDGRGVGVGVPLMDLVDGAPSPRPVHRPPVEILSARHSFAFRRPHPCLA